MTDHITRRPAGSSAIATTLVVALANKVLHLKLTVDEGAAIVGGVTAIVSAFFPNAKLELDKALHEFDLYPDSTTL